MNYFDHEENVKFVDGILEYSQEWQWLFDYIDKRYVFEEPKSWHEFVDNSYSIRELIVRFEKIRNVCAKEWIINNSIIKEGWELAKFYNGRIDIVTCQKSINSLTGKLMLLVLWITKLLNIDNGTDYDFNIGMLQEKNYFQLVNIDEIIKNLDEINEFIDNISITGIDEIKKCLNDNVHYIKYDIGAEAEEKIRKRANTYNAFRFDSIRTNLGATWQEDTIFMLLSRDLREADSDGKVLGTDKKNIIRIKDDIDNKDVKFIVETILFYSFGDIPSDECILAHCEMIRREIINKTDLFNLSISSSCKFIEKLFEKKLTGDWRKDTRFVEMLKAFQVYMTPNDIRRIQQMHIPLSKVQIGVYKKFCESKYKDIEEIKELRGIRDYFEDKDVITGIDKTYFEMLSVKFDELVENSERDIILAVSFYYYMIFLIRVKKENMYIDNQRIQSEMLRIKKLWSTNYYEDVVKSMQVISSQQRISAQKCNEFSKRIMINPILFSNLTMSYDQNKILKEMMKAAENPLIMLVSNIEISEVFPREGAKVNYKRHDIDAKFLEIISEIVENKGYKLLNKMLPEKFVAYIYQNCKIELQLNITLFNEEEKMYNLIKAKAPIELLEYDKKISLAMITQLFPVLEMQIRKLVSYLGIFPYKIDEEEFMQCNDPSSLLRELLLQIYNEQKSFENVSDIMFVYNSMYNSNFLNIRNECIHGRDYLAGGKLRYAFRVTLLCIYMVMFRIDTIEETLAGCAACIENQIDIIEAIQKANAESDSKGFDGLNGTMPGIVSVLQTNIKFLEYAKQRISDMFLKHGYNRYQTDYLKEVMFNAWFDRAQKLKKNDIFDMLCAGCLGYIRPLKQGEVILANTNSYIISFDSTMEKYIHIVRPDNIKLIQKFKNKI